MRPLKELIVYEETDKPTDSNIVCYEKNRRRHKQRYRMRMRSTLLETGGIPCKGSQKVLKHN